MAECGLASVAMVAAYHGHGLDLNALRQRFALSLKGATLADLITIAGKLGFGCRAVRAELEHLKGISKPCILHWDLNHFVVLASADRRGILIHDPALGVRRLAWAQVSKHFSGVALEVVPTAGFTAQRLEIRLRLSDLWSRVVGLNTSLLQTLMLSALLQVFALAAPAYLQLAMDEGISRLDRDFLVILAAGFAAMYAFQALTEALRSWVILHMSQSVTFQISANVLHHLLRLPADYFEKRRVGDILSRIGSTRAIQQALTQSMATTVIDGIMAVATAVALFAYSATIGAIVTTTVALYFAVVATLFPSRRMREQEQLMAAAVAQTHNIESIRASKTIKLYGGEAQREAVWRNHFAAAVSAALAAGRLDILASIARTTLFGAQIVLVVYVGAEMVLRGDLTVGMLFAVLLYRANFVERADGLAQRITEFRLLRLHLERLADIVHTQREEPAAALPAARGVTGHMELRRVSFQYAPNEPMVLRDLSMEVRPGEFVAITGPSGGGKTTLLKIMLGLLQPTSGEVLVDGRPLGALGLHEWRRMLGVVQQDDALLMGTIADNIAFFDPEVDMERVIASAKAASIDDDIRATPMGYLGLVGDMGSSLSGGQKQRILLARALYRNPRIVFLDEGTANLDLETEAKVAGVIEGLGVTRVIVAHRPELLRRADRVLELRGGQLSEQSWPEHKPRTREAAHAGALPL